MRKSGAVPDFPYFPLDLSISRGVKDSGCGKRGSDWWDGSCGVVFLCRYDPLAAPIMRTRMSKVAKESGVQRETLYRPLSERGNPTLDTLTGVLSALDLKISIVSAKSVE